MISIDPDKIKNVLGLPEISDPRYLFIAVQSLWVAYALWFPAYHRSGEQLAICVGTAMIIDFFLHWYFRNIKFFPLSALTASLGAFLMCDSTGLWPYFFVALASITSKHFLRTSESHILNPNNFGIVMAVILFPEAININAARWGGYWQLAAAVAIGGIAVSIRAKRIYVSLGFLSGFVAGAWIRTLILAKPFHIALAPTTGAAFYLYSFYHITDPKTTPSLAKSQLLFGFLVAALDAIMRFYESKYAFFFALFIACPVYAFIKELMSLIKKSNLPVPSAR